jgi:alpha-tubulin suppressor-like RCC1 family protein
LTKAGEVYSWGLNRFAQLGYVIKTAQGEPSPGAGGHDESLGTHGGKNDRTDATGKGNSVDDTIQQTPRRILDALRKEVAVGIVASKMASACWTAKGELFTWGTNSGQLGKYRSEDS